MTFISDSLNRIKPSATMVITAKATQLKREGKKVIGLSSGEPDFDTPQHVKQAAIDAINSGYTKYTNIEGIPELRQSIVEKFKKDNDLNYKFFGEEEFAKEHICLPITYSMTIEDAQIVLDNAF